ncbi:HEPN domain-containing protein [Aquisphaera insulae]|uniref:HEPN domain-containing protein n=1 Tax=Aquisphaera insulae TaxID=2712864 RepID=UPI0013EE0300|nr:HEPN domain-containing protein [Aquisphaera insulae]
MKKAKSRFDANWELAEHLRVLYVSLQSISVPIYQPEDTLRASIVAVVGALDTFVRDLVCVGVREMLAGSRLRTQRFRSLKLPVNVMLSYMENPSQTNAIEQEILNSFINRTYQRPEQIENGILLLRDGDLWRDIDRRLNLAPGDVAKELNSIVDRRNQIVHEGDVDPDATGVVHASTSDWRRPIHEPYVMKANQLILRIGVAIYERVS